MKSVLISIQPKWCELIVSGKKTFELRKSLPRSDSLSVPFKVYIYETKSYSDIPQVYEDGTMIFEGRGKVIGEFVCDYANNVYPTGMFVGDERLTVDGNDDIPIDKYCMTEEQIRAYIGEKIGVGWHISDLEIYDQPKELTKFHAPCDSKCDGMCYEGVGCCRVITRPPQSWCYVEEQK